MYPVSILLEKVGDFFAHPGALLAIFMHVILFMSIYLGLKRFRASLRSRSVFVLAAATILMLEIFLRLTGIMANYFEKKSGRYYSLYDFRPKESILKRKPGETIRLESKGEFSYSYKINSWGYNDLEWDTLKPEGTLRILALGDSFTEGFGAPQDSSWVAQIRRMDFGRPVQWLNAGISGADPFINFQALKTELMILQPDIVIQIISNQDLEQDVPIRGGFERFVSSASVDYPPRPTIEYLKAYSHLSRIFLEIFPERQTFNIKGHGKNLQEWALGQISNAYQDLSSKTGVACVKIFYHTDSYEYQMKGELHHKYVSNEELLRKMQLYSIQDCYKRNLVSEPETFRKMWWKNDGHHNSKGYRMMAECIAEVLQPIIKNHPAAAENPFEQTVQ